MMGKLEGWHVLGKGFVWDNPKSGADDYDERNYDDQLMVTIIIRAASRPDQRQPCLGSVSQPGTVECRLGLWRLKGCCAEKAKRLKKAVKRLKGCYHLVTAFKRLLAKQYPYGRAPLSNTKEFTIKSPFNFSSVPVTVWTFCNSGKILLSGITSPDGCRLMIGGQRNGWCSESMNKPRADSGFLKN